MGINVMEISKTLYITTRKQWGNWLEKNYKIEKEIWLIYPNKNSGEHFLDIIEDWGKY
jgi:uncharacterized protein YdeI (YjbR/CyaY-like superfamily)